MGWWNGLSAGIFSRRAGSRPPRRFAPAAENLGGNVAANPEM